MNDGRDPYIHGTATDEQRRLSRLNELINKRSLARLAIRPGDRVLDVGCGMGQLTRSMAAAAGNGFVLGVERSAEQIAQGEREAGKSAPAVSIRAGDAFSLPLRDEEWGTFDVAHARFLLEHVAEPQRVVDAMVLAVRPGGRIVLEDDDHELLRLHPALTAFERLWAAYMRAYASAGRDPRIGRRLPELLARAGAEPRCVDWPFFGACRGSEDWDAIVSNCRSILSGARPAIQAEGVGAGEFEAGLRAFDVWCETPGAAFWYCTFWAEGARPAAR